MTFFRTYNATRVRQVRCVLGYGAVPSSASLRDAWPSHIRDRLESSERKRSNCQWLRLFCYCTRDLLSTAIYRISIAYGKTDVRKDPILNLPPLDTILVPGTGVAEVQRVFFASPPHLRSSSRHPHCPTDAIHPDEISQTIQGMAPANTTQSTHMSHQAFWNALACECEINSRGSVRAEAFACFPALQIK